MKCLILAAGQGQRIKHITKKFPKCLIKINKESLLQRQIRLLHRLNIKNITVVKGFKAKKINFKSVNYILNKNFKNNEQLDSLFCAKKELNQNVLIIFSDIIFDFSILKKIFRSTLGDIVLAVDRDWKKRYKFRYDHPVGQADKVSIVNKLDIKNIGKKMNLDDANGEFLGILKLTKKGCQIFLKNYIKIKRKKKTNKMQIHDFLKYILKNSNKIKACFTRGKFMEIDTTNDYRIAKKIFNKKYT